MNTKAATASLSAKEIEKAVVAYLAESGIKVTSPVRFTCEIKRKALGPYDFSESAVLTGCTMNAELNVIK